MVSSSAIPGRARARTTGYTLSELLVVMAIAGLILTASTAAWYRYQRVVGLSTTGRTVRLVLQKARFLSIYRGVNHFVVLDPADHGIRIFEDTSAPLASFDSGDTVVHSVRWQPTVTLSLPAEPSPLTAPLGSGILASAWALPLPDSSAAWGTNLRGVMTTPSGKILSAAATPQPIGNGTVVFADSRLGAECVGISVEGRSGSVSVFQFRGNSWEQL
jgi:prepilin-type N-terminal cleavage/methylation domain-containing protein